jgi:hypothetical protein
MQVSSCGAVRFVVVAALGVGAVSWAGAIPASAAPAPAPASAPAAWAIVRGARLAPNNVLNGVVAVSARLAWAVGADAFSSNGAAPGRPVIERWNGRSWSVAQMPSAWPGGLAAVAASSASDAWALGQEPSGTKEHLLHWNGRRWAEITFPGTPGAFYGDLGITAAPGGRAWLIASPIPASQLFAWNGTRWGPQTYPCPAKVCILGQIRARTGSDAWAVGNYVNQSGSGGPLALHWTGRSWRETAVPFVRFGYLTGVFAVSRTNAWAVGAVFNTRTMLLYHWTGTAWRRVRTPAGLTAPAPSELTGITGDATGHLWIYDFGPQAADRASYMRYDGHRWLLIHGALISGQQQVIVRDVAPVPGTPAAWSVGLGFTAGVEARARIERYAAR